MASPKQNPLLEQRRLMGLSLTRPTLAEARGEDASKYQELKAIAENASAKVPEGKNLTKPDAVRLHQEAAEAHRQAARYANDVGQNEVAQKHEDKAGYHANMATMFIPAAIEYKRRQNDRY
jgi:hypothetical protein